MYPPQQAFTTCIFRSHWSLLVMHYYTDAAANFEVLNIIKQKNHQCKSRSMKLPNNYRYSMEMEAMEEWPQMYACFLILRLYDVSFTFYETALWDELKQILCALSHLLNLCSILVMDIIVLYKQYGYHGGTKLSVYHATLKGVVRGWRSLSLYSAI